MTELYIPVLINLPNRNIILHYFLVQLHSILTARTLTAVNPTQFLGFVIIRIFILIIDKFAAMLKVNYPLMINPRYMYIRDKKNKIVQYQILKISIKIT